MRLKRIILVMLALCSMALFAGCADEVGSDQIALKYTAGSVEGKHFDRILEPGSTDFWNFNDEIYSLPISQRSFVVRNDTDRDDGNNPDVDGYISVPSGDNTLVNFEITTAWILNTRTNDIPGYEGGTLRRFFENLCRAYGCWIQDDKLPAGWRKMLREKLYGALEAAFKDQARKFKGDDIVSNRAIEVEGPEGSNVRMGTLTYLQELAAESFRTYLRNQTGGEFFCGPSFDRKLEVKVDDPRACPPVQLLINTADYANRELRTSREAKVVATNQAAAQRTLRKPLKDPNYLEYLRIQAMQQCADNARAVCVFGDSSTAALARR